LPTSADLNYIPNSPLSQQVLPPPPPPPPPLGNATLDRQTMSSSSQRPSVAGINTSNMTKSYGNYETTVTTRATSLPHHILSTSLHNGTTTLIDHHTTLPRKSIHEQEPLLTNNSKSSTPAMMRPPGISPTCPRHGRAAQAQMMFSQQQHQQQHPSRTNSIGSALTLGTNMGPQLEEVQV
jgi:hypothetical protein